MSVVGKLGTLQSIKTKVVVVKVTNRDSEYCYNIAIVYGNNEDFVIVCNAPLNMPKWFNKQGVDDFLNKFYRDSSLPICACEISFNEQEMSKSESFRRILNAEELWGFKAKTYPELPYTKEDGFKGYLLEEDTLMDCMVILTNAPRELIETQVLYDFIGCKREDAKDEFCILKAMGYTVIELGFYDELIKTYGERAILNVICDGGFVRGYEIVGNVQCIYDDLCIGLEQYE